MKSRLNSWDFVPDRMESHCKVLSHVMEGAHMTSFSQEDVLGGSGETETEKPGGKHEFRAEVGRGPVAQPILGSAEIPLYVTTSSPHDAFGGSEFGVWRRTHQEVRVSLQCPAP